MSKQARQKRNVRSLKKSIYILVDGESEQAYIKAFQQKYIRKNAKINMSIHPRFFNKNLNAKTQELLDAISTGYDQIYWLIDYDVVLKEEREGANTKKKLQACDRTLQTFAAQNNCLYEMLYMNPCLEFWFLLHFENTTQLFSNCLKAETALKKHLPEYSKKTQWISQNIIQKLDPYLQSAIIRAVNLYQSSTMDIKARADLGVIFNRLMKELNMTHGA